MQRLRSGNVAFRVAIAGSSFFRLVDRIFEIQNQGVAMDEMNYEVWKEWGQDSFGRFDEHLACYYAAELKKCMLRHDARPRIMEVGFGNGAFLAYCRSRGYPICGVEIIDELVRRAREGGFEAYNDISALPPGVSYDLIFAFDVLEHIEAEALARFLRELKAKLAPDGLLIARFPNGDSPFGRSNQYGDVTHKTVIGSGSIRHLAASTGFDVVYCGSPAVPQTLRDFKFLLYRTLSWPLRFMIEKVLLFVYYPIRPITFEANLVARLKSQLKTSDSE